MLRSVLSIVLLITLVSVTSAGGGFKKKIFKHYAMMNLFSKCIGQEHTDRFVLEMIHAAKKCYTREFDPDIKPLYIRPYPPPNNVAEVDNRQPLYQQQPQFQQPPHYQQYQQPPQYQQPQYRQPQYGFQQQFYGPQFGFQSQYPGSQYNSRQKREDSDEAEMMAPVAVAGEAEMYYYNKIKSHFKSKVGNFTCMMHEMGYLTEDNEIDIEKYKEEYNKLTVPDAMKEEFLDAIDLCQEISECIPARAFEKYPFGREYGRPFIFAMCEKKKAVEVCLKKQMIDDYYKYKELIDDTEEYGDMGNDDDFFSMGL